MSAADLLWFVVGFAAGGVHAWMLWQASQPPFRAMAWHLPRLMLIGGVLFASAVLGALLPTLAGWAVAYLAGVGIFAARSPK